MTKSQIRQRTRRVKDYLHDYSCSYRHTQRLGMLITTTGPYHSPSIPRIQCELQYIHTFTSEQNAPQVFMEMLIHEAVQTVNRLGSLGDDASVIPLSSGGVGLHLSPLGNGAPGSGSFGFDSKDRGRIRRGNRVAFTCPKGSIHCAHPKGVNGKEPTRPLRIPLSGCRRMARLCDLQYLITSPLYWRTCM